MPPALGDCLRRHGAVRALLDQAWMPSPLSAAFDFAAAEVSYAAHRNPVAFRPRPL
jgi:hypothetical protein